MASMADSPFDAGIDPSCDGLETGLMSDPVETFDEQKEAVRDQVEQAIKAYQRLAVLDLGNVTRDNASEMYQEYVEIEIAFEGVGGILDRIRKALADAGESFTDHLEQVGFSGGTAPALGDAEDEQE